MRIRVERSLAAVIPALLLLAGLGLGTVVGGYLITGLITRSTRLGLLLYRPSFEHLVMINMLNSRSEIKRLEGYYALLDGNRIDFSYLMERYRAEESIYIKRTLIWLMGFSKDRRAAMGEFPAMYREAPPQLKREIVRSLYRIDRKLMEEFSRNNRVPGAYLEEFKPGGRHGPSGS